MEQRSSVILPASLAARDPASVQFREKVRLTLHFNAISEPASLKMMSKIEQWWHISIAQSKAAYQKENEGK